MLEALLAGIILITFLVTIKTTYFSVTPEEEVSSTAYVILKELDDSGILRSYAVSDNYNALNSEIRNIYYNHTIEICNPSGACFGEKPVADNVYVGSYFISGGNSYAPRIVNLYLWRQR